MTRSHDRPTETSPQDDDTQPHRQRLLLPAAQPARAGPSRELDARRPRIRRRPSTGSSRRRRRAPGQPAPRRAAPAAPVVGTVVAAALLAAVLASGGTFVALDRDRRARPAGRAGTGRPADRRPVKQPVTIDESSAIIDVAAKAGPAVVRIIDRGRRPERHRPAASTGIGSGVIFDPNGWILTNRHVVAGSNTADVELKDGTPVPRARSTASTR